MKTSFQQDIFLEKLLSANPNIDKEVAKKASGLSLHCLEKSKGVFPMDLIDKQAGIALIAVKEMGLGTAAVASLFLKEWVEAKIVAADEVKKQFDAPTANLVLSLIKVDEINTSKLFEMDAERAQKDSEQPEKQKKAKKRIMTAKQKLQLQLDYYTKMMLAITDDIRAVLLKIAITSYSVRYIEKYSEDEKIPIARQAEYLFAPIAHKLGLYNLKTEMEEVAMKYNHNDIYKFIARKLDETKASRNQFIQDFVDPIKKELKQKGFACEVKGRPKSISSIWNKMKKQSVEFEGIYDLFAIRIILNGDFKDVKEEKEACWNVYSLITNVYTPNPKRLRDWISAPKSSGYESLHTTVLSLPPENKWVEVQIRTHRMNEIAEKGSAAHWRYKEVKGGKENSWHSDIRDLLESDNANLLESPSETKMELYSDRIFVFTPKDEIRSLPKGACILDFAYAIHTAVGEKCVGGKIGNKNYPIKHVLSHGDKVEILTSKNQSPKKEWLNYVVSSRTINRIKRALKQTENEQSALGKEMFEEELRKYNVEPSDKQTNLFTHHFGYKSFIQFFGAVGRGEVNLAKGVKAVLEPEKPKAEDLLKEFESPQKDFVVGKSDDYLIIDEALNIDFQLAACCKPIPGDVVFGFVTATKGTKIHKINCPNARDMISKHPYRIVKAKWTEPKNKTLFAAIIHIKGNNTKGMLADVITLISKDLRINLGNVNSDILTQENFDARITVYIYNRDHLDELIKKLRSLKGVLSVEREEN